MVGAMQSGHIPSASTHAPRSAHLTFLSLGHTRQKKWIGSWHGMSMARCHHFAIISSGLPALIILPRTKTSQGKWDPSVTSTVSSISYRWMGAPQHSKHTSKAIWSRKHVCHVWLTFWNLNRSNLNTHTAATSRAKILILKPLKNGKITLDQDKPGGRKHPLLESCGHRGAWNLRHTSHPGSLCSCETLKGKLDGNSHCRRIVNEIAWIPTRCRTAGRYWQASWQTFGRNQFTNLEAEALQV